MAGDGGQGSGGAGTSMNHLHSGLPKTTLRKGHHGPERRGTRNELGLDTAQDDEWWA